MKLSTLMSILAFAAASSVWAQEFEVNSSSDLGLAPTSATPTTFSERLDGSYALPLGSGGGFTLKAHLSAAYPLVLSADIDEFSALLVYKDPAADVKTLKWTLGRFGLSEATGVILNHVGDGFKLAFDFGSFDLSLQTAYTGLVARSSSGLSLTKTDIAHDKDFLASPRVVASLATAFSPADGHRVTFNALAQQDLNPRAELIPEWQTTVDDLRGGALHTQYLTLQGDGPLSQGLFYDAFFTFGSGTMLSQEKSLELGYQYVYEPIVSFLTGGEITYYLPDLLSSSFHARVLVASGDSDSDAAVEGNRTGWATAFVPVTSTSLGSVFSPALSNLVYYELGATAKPFEVLSLTTAVSVLGFQRAVAGVVNGEGVLNAGPLWMGQEVDLNVTWKPLSDLSVSASVGAFVPTAGTFAAGSAGAGFQYAVKVGAALSL